VSSPRREKRERERGSGGRGVDEFTGIKSATKKREQRKKTECRQQNGSQTGEKIRQSREKREKNRVGGKWTGRTEDFTAEKKTRGTIYRGGKKTMLKKMHGAIGGAKAKVLRKLQACVEEKETKCLSGR